MKIKNSFKIFRWIGGGILSLLVFFWVGFFVWLRVTEGRERAMVRAHLIASDDMNESVGDGTPEETYELFLDTIRDRPLDAVGFLVPEKRAEWRTYLATLARREFIDAFVADLENAEGPRTMHDGTLFYVIRDRDERPHTVIRLVPRNNGTWNIEII